ncbi:MAG: HAD family hydrolase [Clostridiaceae bacterium]|mgnify:CR=1 FL=1|nr:HAD family hydrolase [Clostridiaceae bacterium]
MIQAVFFDIGGTLHTVTSDEQVRARFIKELRKRLEKQDIRIPVDDDVFSSLLHQNAERYKHHVEQTLWEWPADRIWDEFYLADFDVGRDKLAPISEELSFLYNDMRVVNTARPHVKEVMDALKKRNLRLGIISNTISTTFSPYFLRECGIYDAMEMIILSSEVGFRKPSHEIFRLAIDKLEIEKDAFCYVGDTLSRDVLGCKNAGIGLSIQIDNPAIYHRDEGFLCSGLEPDYKITDLLEIIPIIDKII